MTFPLDFNKTNPGNITTYTINFDSQHRIWNCFAIPDVFFFGNTVSISYVDLLGNTVNLTPNVDFKPMVILDNVSSAVDGDNIYAGINVLNSAVSGVQLSVTCHVLGGGWSINESTLGSIINQMINSTDYHWAACLVSPIAVNIGGVIKNIDITNSANILTLFNNGYGPLSVKAELGKNLGLSSGDQEVTIASATIETLASSIATRLAGALGSSSGSSSPLTIAANSISDISTSVAAAINIMPTTTPMGHYTLVSGDSNKYRLPAVALTAGIPIFAMASNSGDIYITQSASDTYAGAATSTTTYPLSPGEATVLTNNNMNTYYVLAATGDGVKWGGGK